MSCIICQRFEEKLEELGRIHAGAVRMVEESWREAEHSQLRRTEIEANLDFEMLRAELSRHRRNKHPAS
jgi:hypothetical protein